MHMLSELLSTFGLPSDHCSIHPFGSGLINTTWKVDCEGRAYILQQINQEVFVQPWLIDENTNALAEYLTIHFPEYLFIKPIPARDGKSMIHWENEAYFRLMPFVSGSVTYSVAESSQLGYEAARQFGKFTWLLAGFPVSTLHEPLPDFHNLSLRYAQFEAALIYGDPARIGEAADTIQTIRQFREILQQFERIRNNPGFSLRVTHHDTKINNVLFDTAGKGLCVIDLDTVMPGYFISDLGDMMRTCLPPVSEEEMDCSRIIIREDYFEAIVSGYLEEMGDELGPEELGHIVYAGKFMIYMQAIRFLTDHLNLDRYYGAKYPGHNLVRACNQTVLLKRLTEKEAILTSIVKKYCSI
jgi:Ser/Thr protein kinase RdoA (MazF antagonist)